MLYGSRMKRPVVNSINYTEFKRKNIGYIQKDKLTNRLILKLPEEAISTDNSTNVFFQTLLVERNTQKGTAINHALMSVVSFCTID